MDGLRRDPVGNLRVVAKLFRGVAPISFVGFA
jgi:hypothetical protein